MEDNIKKLNNLSNSYGSLKEGIELVPANDGPTYTVEEAVDKIGFGRFQIKLSIISGLAWMSDSMELMVLSILGPVLLCEWSITSVDAAMLTTVVFIGFTLGSPFSGWLGDKFGRRTSLFANAACAAIFGLLSAAAPNYAWLLLFRGLTGVGLSGVPQAITYYSEFLPGRLRGKCIMLLELFWAVGCVFEVILAILVLDNFGWKWWLVASSIPLLIFLPLCMTLPKSPRYLLACGETEKAEETLIQIAKLNKSTLPPGHLRQEPEIPRAKFVDLLRPEYRRSTLLLWVMWFTMMSAYFGVALMSTEIIQRGTECVLGEPAAVTNVTNGSLSAACQPMDITDYVKLLWTSTAEIAGIILTVVYVDRFGRKLSMRINLTVYTLAICLMFICANSIYLVAMMFFSRAMAVSALQVMFVYTTELYPTAFRAIGMGTSNMFARFGAVVTPFFAEVLLDKNMAGALFVYAVFGAVPAVCTIFLPLEARPKHTSAEESDTEDINERE